MPSRKFKFPKDDGDIQIEVAWKFLWKEITVKINNEIARNISNKKELDKGVEFYYDGIKYLVQMKTVLMSPQLVVEVNDQPIPGSSNDPKTMVRNGFYLIFFLMALNVVVGITSIVGKVEVLQNLGVGYYNIFAAFIYFILYIISKKFNLLAGLVGCSLFFIIDWVMAIISLSRTSPNSISSTVVLRLILGTILFLACKGAYKLQGRIVSHAEI